MPVRETETRIPAGYTANDLGQTAVSATHANVTLISYLSSPLAARRLQNYVVMVADAALAPTVQSYEWIFTNGAPTHLITSVGIAEFTPQNLGSLTVTVHLKSNANATLATVTMTQQVVALNTALELKIEQQERAFPGAAHPDTSRELLNDLRLYINDILPIATDELVNKTISSLAYARALELPAWRRNIIIENQARVLNTNPAGFYQSAKDGFGVCRTRPQLAAMFINNPATGNPYIHPFIELPVPATRTQRTDHEAAIQNAYGQLSTANQVDIFNLLRFPKSHFKVCRQILDGLESRYFPSQTLPQTLAVSLNARRLITEYETGLIAFTRPLSASTFSGRVQAMINNPVWAIPMATLAGAGGAGAPGPPAAAAQVGIPEKFPSLTFVADGATEAGFGAGAVGFLRMAVVYHDIFAQNAQTVDSFEDLIHRLRTPAAPITRLRIVTHFGGAVTAPVPDGIIFMPFFTDQRNFDGSVNNHTKFWHYQYGISDEQGLKAFFENALLPGVAPDFLSKEKITTTTITAQTFIYLVIIKRLQELNDPVLVPFRLQRGNPAGALLNIIKWAGNLFMINNVNLQVNGVTSSHTPATLPNLVKTAIIDFVNSKINSLSTPSGALSSANVIALRDKMAGMSFADLNATFVFTDFPFIVPDVYADNHDQLRADLAVVRTRLNNSFVDVRGCRIGQDRRYMRALRAFIGNPGSEPEVSGPEWYQGFGHLGNLEFNSEGQVDLFFNSGHRSSGFSAADVQREYSAWSGRIGINSQLSFWGGQVNGNVFDFLRMDWRSQLPLIGMESVKMESLAAADYPAVVATMVDLFKIPAGTAPSVADLNSFNTTMIPQVTALQTIQDAITPLTNATPQPALQVQLTAIQGVATATGQVLAAAPIPLTKDYLQNAVDQVKGFLVTRSALQPLFTAIGNKLNDPKAGIRYMLSIGLGLLVQSAAREGQNRLAYYAADKTNALKSWLKIHWEKPMPVPAITAINALNPVGAPVRDTHGNTDPNDDDFNDTAQGLFYSSLAIDHRETQTATNPSEEFHQHILKEP